MSSMVAVMVLHQSCSVSCGEPSSSFNVPLLLHATLNSFLDILLLRIRQS
jgi:hypothetical protein